MWLASSSSYSLQPRHPVAHIVTCTWPTGSIRPPARLACQLAEASQKLAGAEAERDQLRGMLDDERSTAFASLGKFHKQQVSRAAWRHGCRVLGGRLVKAGCGQVRCVTSPFPGLLCLRTLANKPIVSPTQHMSACHAGGRWPTGALWLNTQLSPSIHAQSVFFLLAMQEDAGLRTAKAEGELRSLQERLREEQAACDALKKQMGEWVVGSWL